MKYIRLVNVSRQIDTSIGHAASHSDLVFIGGYGRQRWRTGRFSGETQRRTDCETPLSMTVERRSKVLVGTCISVLTYVLWRL